MKLITPLFPIYFPNTKGRIRAAQLHDLHHIATGYKTDWAGEAEIGAWELASGCSNYFMAWLLNFYSFSFGLVAVPIRVYKAFICGCSSKNLYHLEKEGFQESILEDSVGKLQERLELDHSQSPKAQFKIKFFFWYALAVTYGIAFCAIFFYLIKFL